METKILLLGLILVSLRWVYAVLYPRKEIQIQRNGIVIRRKKKWFSLNPRDIINIEPIKAGGHFNIQFCVPPDIGEVTFHIHCFMTKDNIYTLDNGKKKFYGKPV